MTFDLAALADELARKGPQDAGNVWTTTELQVKLGKGLIAVKRFVQAAIAAQRARPAWKPVEDMHGGVRRVKAYEFL